MPWPAGGGRGTWKAAWSPWPRIPRWEAVHTLSALPLPCRHPGALSARLSDNSAAGPVAPKHLSLAPSPLPTSVEQIEGQTGPGTCRKCFDSPSLD